MKVILLMDVKNYGKKDQIVEVSDGFAQNFLIPKKMAILATRNDIGHLNVKIKNDKTKAINELEDTKKLKVDIENIELNFRLKTHDHKIIGSVSLKQITDRLDKEFDLKLDKRKFVKHENLTQIGLNYLTIKLEHGITAMLKVNIEGII